MSVNDSRSLSKWNAIRSKAVPSNVIADADSSLLNPRAAKQENEKRKDMLPAKLHRQPGNFQSSEPHSSNVK